MLMSYLVHLMYFFYARKRARKRIWGSTTDDMAWTVGHETRVGLPHAQALRIKRDRRTMGLKRTRDGSLCHSISIFSDTRNANLLRKLRKFEICNAADFVSVVLKRSDMMSHLAQEQKHEVCILTLRCSLTTKMASPLI